MTSQKVYAEINTLPTPRFRIVRGGARCGSQRFYPPRPASADALRSGLSSVDRSSASRGLARPSIPVLTMRTVPLLHRLNGKTVRIAAAFVQGGDAVTLDGRPVPVVDEAQLLADARVWMYHKPPGLVVTHKDPERRRTVFEALTGRLPTRVVSVGRLDLQSEGLLLLTDTGALARRLELPSSGFVRTPRRGHL